jgi:DHA1 family bicyclomycin/chloramphenicol resistance-like MFS transporter
MRRNPVHPTPCRPEAASCRPSLWLLVMVTFTGTAAMHMFVPALPAVAADLATSAAAAQMTITMYIAGLALGQLFYGPVADCFGRRPTLLAGMAIFTAAGIVAMGTSSPTVLVAARFMQAIGGCAGLLLARAIVRDVVAQAELVGTLATLNLMMMLGPGLAPFIGASINAAAGWRCILAALAALGLLNLVLAWKHLPETGRPSGILSVASVIADYRLLLGARSFVWVVVGSGCATTSMYAFITCAPFIWARTLHRPSTEMGLYLGLMIIGLAVGNLLSKSIARRWTPDRMMTVASLLSLASAAALLALVLCGCLTAPRIGIAMFAYSAGAGMCAPAAMSRAFSVDPRVTGSAAGLYGFAQMACGALFTILASIGRDPALSAAVVMVGAGLVAQFSFRMASTRRPDPASHAATGS